MKFDKETIIVFGICAVVLFAWQPFCQYMGWLPKPNQTQKQVQQEKVAAPQTSETKADKAKTVKSASSEVTENKKIDQPKIAILPEQKLEGKFSSFTFSPNTGIVDKITFLKYFNQDRETCIQFKDNLAPGALAVFGATEWKVDEIVDNSKSSENKSYKLVRKITNGVGKKFVLTQKWEISDDYILNYSFSIKNSEKSELVFPELSVMGVGLLPFSVLTNDKHIRQETNSIDYCTVSGSLECIKTNDDNDDFFAPNKEKIRWCGGANKYFATMIAAEKPFDKIVPKRKFIPETDKQQEHYWAALGGGYVNLTVPAGSEKTFNFKCYNGPKIIDQLAKFDNKAPDIMNLSYGGPMDWIAEKLLSFLIFLKGICGSYGWSIIIITIIVRLLFWPITQKANSSMKRMQKLQPQMKEIREKYKDDPQTMNAKVMELYRQEKVNPLGGCLPILLQIPVFIALYSTLNGAVELRQVPFWYIADLAKPDTIATLFGVLDINPLVIIMTGLMVLQQRLTPAAMDPMQQKMMMFMPVFMLFILYNLPAGLTLYWTVSQIFAILQLLLQKKLNSEENKPVKKAA